MPEFFQYFHRIPLSPATKREKNYSIFLKNILSSIALLLIYPESLLAAMVFRLAADFTPIFINKQSIPAPI
ncbi:MAG: hypothetical protein A2909_03080 [Candidatus Tagabacteria bacterium RIFCSPLOWO2_01_FULL_39_11]|uniref:Uncharacterized protein n=1 Tax=Candidatus Tagabacteria bacterium RIFCSPLOWO2_01_FULL_39_11 TaxID=1802295 RepID=A0A1G2LTE9_9BACT|nr:MAG: hypothetical protein A2909_03080 [Candidatus Tagabacteria bacterium RIFCSPLOWO2_01_FULL_39_11]